MMGRSGHFIAEVVEDLIVFAMPALRALSSREKLTQKWKAGTGWISSVSRVELAPSLVDFFRQ
jgi:hypothetical protein